MKACEIRIAFLFSKKCKRFSCEFILFLFCKGSKPVFCCAANQFKVLIPESRTISSSGCEAGFHFAMTSSHGNMFSRFTIFGMWKNVHFVATCKHVQVSSSSCCELGLSAI